MGCLRLGYGGLTWQETRQSNDKPLQKPRIEVAALMMRQLDAPPGLSGQTNDAIRSPHRFRLGALDQDLGLGTWFGDLRLGSYYSQSITVLELCLIFSCDCSCNSNVSASVL